MKRVSLKTIAAEVGVTASTVSRVLSNDVTCYVSSLKRDAILDAIKRHKYTPNINARNLLLGKTSNIAFVTRKFDHFQRFGPFLLSAIDGIQEELQKFGYSCSLVTINSADDVERLSNEMSLYDGIIFGRHVVTDDAFKILSEKGKPTVFLDERENLGHDFACVKVNRKTGIMELGVHLRALGCRRIAMYGLADDIKVFNEVFNEIEINLNQRDIYTFTTQSIYNLMFDAYEKSSPVLNKLSSYDAICCSNDFVAHGLCKRLKDRNVRIGRDIAVSGFDNVDELLEVPQDERFLTTVDKPRKNMGRECAKLLLEKINGGVDSIVMKEIDSKLIIRASTADFGSAAAM